MELEDVDNDVAIALTVSEVRAAVFIRLTIMMNVRMLSVATTMRL